MHGSHITCVLCKLQTKYIQSKRINRIFQWNNDYQQMSSYSFMITYDIQKNTFIWTNDAFYLLNQHFELHVTSNDLEKPCHFDEYIRKVWSVKQNIEFRQEIVEISFDLFMSFTNKLLMITHFRSVHTRSSKHNALSEIYSENI